uniref:Uncharacterized protein n=1 Tax=Romanomermis culicivorax TaxID=13658 RepID=A0A915KTF0_ROMCU
MIKILQPPMSQDICAWKISSDQEKIVTTIILGISKELTGEGGDVGKKGFSSVTGRSFYHYATTNRMVEIQLTTGKHGSTYIFRIARLLKADELLLNVVATGGNGGGGGGGCCRAANVAKSNIELTLAAARLFTMKLGAIKPVWFTCCCAKTCCKFLHEGQANRGTTLDGANSAANGFFGASCMSIRTAGGLTTLPAWRADLASNEPSERITMLELGTRNYMQFVHYAHFQFYHDFKKNYFPTTSCFSSSSRSRNNTTLTRTRRRRQIFVRQGIEYIIVVVVR